MPSFAPDETDKKTLPQGVNGSARPVGGRNEISLLLGLVRNAFGALVCVVNPMSEVKAS